MKQPHTQARRGVAARQGLRDSTVIPFGPENVSPAHRRAADTGPQGLGATAASSDVPRLVPVTKWPERHDWPPLGGLRHLIFHAKTNGFEQVVRRSGRRVLIDEQAFFRWMALSQEVK